MRNLFLAFGLLLISAGGAYGACTAEQIETNKVAAQYGMTLYDCDKDEVSQASKDEIFEVVWTGYKAKGGVLSKAYIKTRWERVESSFWSVWKDSPVWQARVAVAICTKEYLCGVAIKFSNWDSYRFESPLNRDGSIDCGITQINSKNTSFSCDQLQDLKTAFKEQKRIIFLKVGGSSKKSVWKAKIHRYNHLRNYQYGEVIWQWSGVSF